MFSNKKDKGKKVQTPPPVAEQNAVTSAARSKQKSGMEEFFNISVPESALETFDENKNFFQGDKRDESARYVGMMLHAETIGGFNKKSKGDADKGMIIEAISGGNIDTYITAEQNAADELIFIPTGKTFDFLEDFSILTNAEYEAVKIHFRNGAIEKTGIVKSFAKFRNVQKGTDSIGELLGAAIQVSTSSAETAIPPVASTPPTAPVLTVPPALPAGAEVPPVPALTIPDTSAAPQLAPPTADASAPVNPTETPAAPQSAPAVLAQEDDSPDEEDDDAVYTEADVTREVTRRYYSEGLDLVVSPNPFDLMFVSGNKQILFETDQKDGFVDGELNRMAKNANVELQRLRQKRLYNMRKDFLESASECAILLQQKHDIQDPTTEFGRKKADLEDKRKGKVETIDALVSEESARLNQDYSRTLQAVMEEGARKAKSEYALKHGKDHSRKIERLPADIRTRIQSEHSVELNELYHERQSVVITSFDYMTTQLLKELSQKQFVELIKEEDELYAKYTKQLEDYASRLHQEDARRVMVEEERLRIQNDVGRVREELKAKIDELTQNYEVTKQALESKHSNIVSGLQQQNAFLREQMDISTDSHRQEKEALEQSLEKMQQRYASAHSEATENCRTQVENARHDAESWRNSVTVLQAQHSRSNKIAIVLMAAVAIMMLCIGFVVAGIWYGQTFNRGDTTSSAGVYVENDSAPVQSDSDDESVFED
jgi:hypothetical protein